MRKIFFISLIVLLITGCSQIIPQSKGELPTLTPPINPGLPATWTIIPTESNTPSPQVSRTPTSTPTPVPGENWWTVSLGKSRKLEFRSGTETSDGGYLFWVQEKNSNFDVFRDSLIKLTATGQLVWEKSILPYTARVHGLQVLDDGSIFIFGYYENGDYLPAPFVLTLTDQAEIISQNIYQGHYQSTDYLVLKVRPGEKGAWTGYPRFSGDLPGNTYISDYKILPNGDIVIIGFIADTLVSAGGGSFSGSTGLWAVKYDQNNRIIWQRFFKSRFGPWFYGSILQDGSIVLAKSSLYDYDSILKLNPDGYTEYWKHYTSIYIDMDPTETTDGGLILTGKWSNLLELDSQGEIVNSIEFSNDLDKISLRYAFETSQGDLILAAKSDLNGIIISRLNISYPFPDCPHLSFIDNQLGEYFPLPAYNISGAVKAKFYTSDLEESDPIITLEERSSEWIEICRYQDPNPAQDQ